MNNTPKVSVIVPVYKVPEQYLRRCIESLIAQTLDEIEIILVDDGSPDQCGKICDNYADLDNRIKVIHKENGGLSAARNSGYHASRGEWITFLDGDDWIEPTTCRENYNYGVEKAVDLVIFGTVQDFESQHLPFRYHYNDGKIFQDDECKQLQSEILNFNGNIATAWAKLIRKSILDENHIEHNPALRQGSEGIEFNIRLFEKIKSAAFTDKIYYHYIFNSDSISAKHDEKNHQFVIQCFEEVQKQITKSGNREALEKLFYNRFAYVIVAVAISGYFSPNNPEKYFDRKKSFKKYLENRLVQETLEKCNRTQLGKQRKIILKLIDLKLWALLQSLAIVRYKQKH